MGLVAYWMIVFLIVNLTLFIAINGMIAVLELASYALRRYRQTSHWQKHFGRHDGNH